jgi:hypothetical protein
VISWHAIQHIFAFLLAFLAAAVAGTIQVRWGMTGQHRIAMPIDATVSAVVSIRPRIQVAPRTRALR